MENESVSFKSALQIINVNIEYQRDDLLGYEVVIVYVCDIKICVTRGRLLTVHLQRGRYDQMGV